MGGLVGGLYATGPDQIERTVKGIDWPLLLGGTTPLKISLSAARRTHAQYKALWPSASKRGRRSHPDSMLDIRSVCSLTEKRWPTLMSSHSNSEKIINWNMVLLEPPEYADVGQSERAAAFERNSDLHSLGRSCRLALSDRPNESVIVVNRTSPTLRKRQ